VAIAVPPDRAIEITISCPAFTELLKLMVLLVTPLSTCFLCCPSVIAPGGSDGLTDAEGDKDAEGETDALLDALGDSDLLAEALGDSDPEGESDAEGESERDADAEGLALAEALALGESDADGDCDLLAEADGERDGESMKVGTAIQSSSKDAFKLFSVENPTRPEEKVESTVFIIQPLGSAFPSTQARAWICVPSALIRSQYHVPVVHVIPESASCKFETPQFSSRRDLPERSVLLS
jgi:hypothetical protein